MRRATWTAVVLVAAGVATALAQEPPDAADAKAAASTAADAAEHAYLRAYFREKELKDHAGAEKAYAAVVEQFPAERGVVARALLGRLRSLLGLGRKDDASALVDVIGRDFRDYGSLVADARALLAQAATPAAADRANELRLRLRGGPNDALTTVPYGDRVVPLAVEQLRDDSPQLVQAAARVLVAIPTDAARAAFRDALREAATTYPGQVAEVVRGSTQFTEEILRAGAESPNEEIRRASVVVAWGRGIQEDWVLRPIFADPVLIEQLLGPRKQLTTTEWVRLLVAAAGSGPGPARDAALARLRDTSLGLGSNYPGLDAFTDVSDAFIQDHEVLEAAAGRVAMWLTASPKALRAMLAHPPTARTALNAILQGQTSAAVDPALFVDALERDPGALRNVTPASNAAAAVTRVLGDRPRAEHVGRVARLLTPGWKGQGVAELAERLAARGADEAAFRALVENLSSGELQMDAVGWASRTLAAGGRDAMALGVLHGAVASSRAEVRNAALMEITQKAGDRQFDVQPFVDRATALLDDPASAWAAAGVLRFGGERGARELVRRVEIGQPALGQVLSMVGAIRDTSAAPKVESVLARSTDPEIVQVAAWTLIALRGEEALPALREAIRRDGGAHARPIALAALDAPDRIGTGTVTDLLLAARLAGPGQLGWYPPDMAEGREKDPLTIHLSVFPATERRRLALSALQSPSFEDRRWGAAQAGELLDAAAWDALIVAAEDPDAYVRAKSRAALSQIVANQEEMQRYRAMGEERAARVHAEKLLRSKDPQERFVGIAAVLALRIESLVPVLIQLAAEDPTPAVAEEARKALLTLGAAAAGAR